MMDVISAAVPVTNISSAVYNSDLLIERSITSYPRLRAIIIAVSLVMPSRIESDSDGVYILFLLTIFY